MPKIRKWTLEKIEKLIVEGYGQGEGKDYKPWIQIGDFSSQGRGARILGHKTGRVHHFLSDLESNYYYQVIWSESVVDIREQYPLLPLHETGGIAEELGIVHPRTPGATCNSPMTTDFLITVCEQDRLHLEARFVKYSKDLSDPRVQEKLIIEKRYWENREVPFKIVTENSVNKEKVGNIADYYLPNRKEAMKITGSDTIEGAAESLSKFFRHVIIKLDREGCLLKSGEKIQLIPSLPHVVNVDSTGAGDAFMSEFLFGLYHHYDVEDCIRCGNVMGSVCVSQVGCITGSLTERELLQKFEEYYNYRP